MIILSFSQTTYDMKNLFFIFLALTYYSCTTQLSKGNSRLINILDHTKIIEIKDSFEMTIIKHSSPSAGCGTRAFASNTLGTWNNDTIRVFDLCNTDTTLSNGQRILVVPMEPPSYQVSISGIYYSLQNNDSLKYYDATWGEIKRLK